MQSRIITLLLIALCLQTSCQSAERPVKDLASFKGKTVGEFLESYSLKLSDAAFYDEPPGKLMELKFRDHLKLGGKTVIVRLRYTVALFSTTGKWDPVVVKRTIIEDVSEVSRN